MVSTVCKQYIVSSYFAYFINKPLCIAHGHTRTFQGIQVLQQVESHR